MYVLSQSGPYCEFLFKGKGAIFFLYEYAFFEKENKYLQSRVISLYKHLLYLTVGFGIILFVISVCDPLPGNCPPFMVKQDAQGCAICSSSGSGTVCISSLARVAFNTIHTYIIIVMHV